MYKLPDKNQSYIASFKISPRLENYITDKKQKGINVDIKTFKANTLTKSILDLEGRIIDA